MEKDRKKIKKGIALSPILLVRDSSNGKLIIADSYGCVQFIHLMRA
jgi:hypothetical protein